MTSLQIIQETLEIRDYLKREKDCVENPIDILFNPVPPFCGKEEIKLIIIKEINLVQN